MFIDVFNDGHLLIINQCRVSVIIPTNTIRCTYSVIIFIYCKKPIKPITICANRLLKQF